MITANAQRERSHINGRNIRPFVFKAEDTAAVLPGLGKLGIDMGDARNLREMMKGYGLDALAPSITTPSLVTPVQFLQQWLPGLVYIITAARKADEILGMSVVGAWEDEEVVLQVIEQTGQSRPYGDMTNVPLANWNVNYERRTVVRFEEGMRVGVLEEARASRANINSSETKRGAAANELEIQRNRVAFFGFNNGANRTYGYLNDPNLPAASAFPNGVASGTPAWSGKNFQEITKDIRILVVALRTASQDTIDPESTDMTLTLPTSVVDFLSVMTDQGVSVRQWMKEFYPRIRVVSAPEMENAVAGDNVAYLQADAVDDGVSTDNRRVWDQIVPTKFKLVGVQAMVKGSEEDYSNATAGALLKRGYGMVRRTGC